MRELAYPNQTVKSQHVLCDISAPWTRINLSFASLKPCGLTGHFEYNKPEFDKEAKENSFCVFLTKDNSNLSDFLKDFNTKDLKEFVKKETYIKDHKSVSVKW